MKKLIILLLFTLPIFEFSEAQSASDRLDIIEEQVNALRAELGSYEPVEGISAVMLSPDRIEIRWEANQEGQMDIQYYDPTRNREWQHSVWRYRGPVSIEDGQADIGVGVNTDWIIRLVVDDWVSDSFVAKAYESEEQDEDFSFRAIQGTCDDCYYIHGIERIGEPRPPSLDPNDWEIITDTHSPVVDHSATVGHRKIDPVGFYMTENNLALFYNSGWDDYARWFELEEERGYKGSTNQSGSLIAFKDDFEFEDYSDNPVLDRPQLKWQGRNRVNPYAVVWHPEHQTYYAFYGDFAEGGDCDKYPGRRALGLAKSEDLINWEYLSTDEPLFHVESVYNLVPDAFPNDNFCRQGRLYAFGATWVDDRVYLNVGGSIDGTNYSATLTAYDPQGEWQGIVTDGQRPMPIKIGNKWYRVQNTADPNDGNKRALAIAVADDVSSRGINHHVIATGHGGSAGVSRQLFKYKGKWHIAYRQRNEQKWESGEGDYRDLFIAREK